MAKKLREVFVVCHGAKDADVGDFHEPECYLSYDRAMDAACECMAELAQPSTFKSVGPAYDHVSRQWNSENHTVWLEVLKCVG